MDADLGHRHTVKGECARFVRAENGRCAEHLDRRHPAGKHLALRDAPRPQGQEDGHHHGEFLGQRGHGQGDARQKPVQPDCRASAHRRRRRCTQSTSPWLRSRVTSTAGLLLQVRVFGYQGLEGLADLADFRARPRGMHLADALALDDQGAGKDKRLIVAARSAPWPTYRPSPACLRTGMDSPVRRDSSTDRLSAESRTVSAGTRSPSSRRTIVVAHHLPAGDALLLPVADDQGSGAGKIPEGIPAPVRFSAPGRW